MGENIYIGRGKYGMYDILKINICISDLEKYTVTAKNGKKYIDLDIVKTRQPDNNGNTHSVKINTWKANNKVC